MNAAPADFVCSRCGAACDWSELAAFDLPARFCERCVHAADNAEFRLVLRAEPPCNDALGRSPVIRLRRALKVLLRRFGLRATKIEHAPRTPSLNREGGS